MNNNENNENSVPSIGTTYVSGQVEPAAGQVVPAAPYVSSGQVEPAATYGAGQVVPAAPYSIPPPVAFGIGLPPHLWPHNFIHFSVICTVAVGFFNIFTLFFFIPSIILGVAGHSQSQKGNYEKAKRMGKITMALNVTAISMFLFSFALGTLSGPAFSLPLIIRLSG